MSFDLTLSGSTSIEFFGVEISGDIFKNHILPNLGEEEKNNLACSCRSHGNFLKHNIVSNGAFLPATDELKVFLKSLSSEINIELLKEKISPASQALFMLQFLLKNDHDYSEEKFDELKNKIKKVQEEFFGKLLPDIEKKDPVLAYVLMLAFIEGDNQFKSSDLILMIKNNTHNPDYFSPALNFLQKMFCCNDPITLAKRLHNHFSFKKVRPKESEIKEVILEHPESAYGFLGIYLDRHLDMREKIIRDFLLKNLESTKSIYTSYSSTIRAIGLIVPKFSSSEIKRIFIEKLKDELKDGLESDKRLFLLFDAYSRITFSLIKDIGYSNHESTLLWNDFKKAFFDIFNKNTFPSDFSAANFATLFLKNVFSGYFLIEDLYISKKIVDELKGEILSSLKYKDIFTINFGEKGLTFDKYKNSFEINFVYLNTNMASQYNEYDRRLIFLNLDKSIYPKMGVVPIMEAAYLSLGKDSSAENKKNFLQNFGLKDEFDFAKKEDRDFNSFMVAIKICKEMASTLEDEDKNFVLEKLKSAFRSPSKLSRNLAVEACAEIALQFKYPENMTAFQDPAILLPVKDKIKECCILAPKKAKDKSLRCNIFLDFCKKLEHKGEESFARLLKTLQHKEIKNPYPNTISFAIMMNANDGKRSVLFSLEEPHKKGAHRYKIVKENGIWNLSYVCGDRIRKLNIEKESKLKSILDIAYVDEEMKVSFQKIDLKNDVTVKDIETAILDYVNSYKNESMIASKKGKNINLIEMPIAEYVCSKAEVTLGFIEEFCYENPGSISEDKGVKTFVYKNQKVNLGRKEIVKDFTSELQNEYFETKNREKEYKIFIIYNKKIDSFFIIVENNEKTIFPCEREKFLQLLDRNLNIEKDSIESNMLEEQSSIAKAIEKMDFLKFIFNVIAAPLSHKPSLPEKDFFNLRVMMQYGKGDYVEKQYFQEVPATIKFYPDKESDPNKLSFTLCNCKNTFSSHDILLRKLQDGNLIQVSSWEMMWCGRSAALQNKMRKITKGVGTIDGLTEGEKQSIFKANVRKSSRLFTLLNELEPEYEKQPNGDNLYALKFRSVPRKTFFGSIPTRIEDENSPLKEEFKKRTWEETAKLIVGELDLSLKNSSSKPGPFNVDSVKDVSNINEEIAKFNP